MLEAGHKVLSNDGIGVSLAVDHVLPMTKAKRMNDAEANKTKKNILEHLDKC